jgi:hypothetical protein
MIEIIIDMVRILDLYIAGLQNIIGFSVLKVGHKAKGEYLW